MYRAIILGSVLLITTTPAFAQLVSARLDYPPLELRAGIQGDVGFEVKLAADGKVDKCKVTKTSGNTDLDNKTCSQLRETGQFKPAVDPAGRAIKSTYASTLRWRIPHAATDTQSPTVAH